MICTRHVHDLLMTCPWLAHELFSSCSWVGHALFITFPWLVIDLFITFSWLVRDLILNDLFITYSWPVNNLCMACQQLSRYLFMTCLTFFRICMTCSQFTICCDLFMTCSWLVHEQQASFDVRNGYLDKGGTSCHLQGTTLPWCFGWWHQTPSRHPSRHF